MKTKVKNNVTENNSITVFRYKMEDLEKKLNQEHEEIKNGIAIPLGKDLGNMQPSKPHELYLSCQNYIKKMENFMVII